MDAAVSTEIDKFCIGKGVKDSALLKAVAWVESAGVFFWTVKGVRRPAIRFEGHYFYRILKAEKPHLLDAAVKAGLANPKSGAVKNPNSWEARYDLFARACAIDEGIAIRSVSWGIGQVMGDWYNELGYATPKAMMDDAHNGVTGQLEIMYRFIVQNKLLAKLMAKDWAGFAKAYNGPNYKVNKYDTNLAAAYKQFAKAVSTGADAGMILIQTKLAALGLYTGQLDGLNGPQTKGAIQKFQQAAGLVVDGNPGSVTVEQLDAFLRSAEQTKTKTITVPTLVGGGVAGAGIIGQVSTVMTTAQTAADQSKGLLETLNIAPIIVSVIVACVVAGVVIWYLKSVRQDDRIKQLSNVNPS